MSDRPTWFSRTFDHGRKSLAPAAGLPPFPPPAAANDHQLEEARLVAKAEALSASAALARVYEDKGADAGMVRLVLASRADEAWTRVDAHHHAPLEEADSSRAASASSSGTVGLSADDSSAVPLLETRLRLIAESLDSAIDTVSGKSGQRLLGGASASVAAYLRTIQRLAAQGSRPPADVPEPQSLKAVDPPKLHVVK